MACCCFIHCDPVCEQRKKEKRAGEAECAAPDCADETKEQHADESYFHRADGGQVDRRCVTDAAEGTATVGAYGTATGAAKTFAGEFYFTEGQSKCIAAV